MFSDIDESLRQLFTAGIPIRANEIDISFERPTREWSSKLSRPTINLFLYDIRERAEMQNEPFDFDRTRAPGTVVRRRRPLRLDASYTVTAWTRDPVDEHRILAAVLACLYRSSEIPDEFLSQAVRDLDQSVTLRLAPPDHIAKPADFWGVMDNDLHANVNFVAIVPINPFAEEPFPLVTSASFELGLKGEGAVDRFQAVGGVVHAGELSRPLEGMAVTLVGTALSGVTGEDGRFLLGNVPAGQHQLRVTDPAGRAITVDINVPSPSFDILFNTT